MDILFAHSYFYRFDPKQWRAKQPYPPYGTLCAAALMRAEGYAVGLFDTNLRQAAAEIEPVLNQTRPRYLVLYDDGFNYLTKMCLSRMREAAFELIRYGKAHGCTVIVNSSDSSDQFDQYLAQGADVVVLGEGELGLRELVAILDSGQRDLSGVLGIAYRTENGETVKNPKRPVLTDLDSLPDPAWDLVDMEAYRHIWMTHHGYFSLNIATTRGCPYKCNWCAKPIYGNRYNARSPERVVGELAMLVERYGARHFWVSDDIFGLKPGWVQRFRDLVTTQGLRFRYKIQSRVDLLLQADTIDALAASGLQQVWVGAESGSQKILDAMDKGTTVEEIRASTQLLKAKGIEVCFFLQFGYLGETEADIQATIALLEELMPHDIGVSVSYPLPGTKFYERVRALLGDKQNWTDSDDLAMMYPATFSQAYYRRLHRLVHKRFRLRQGLAQWRRFRQTGQADWRRLLSVAYYVPAAFLNRQMLKTLRK